MQGAVLGLLKPARRLAGFLFLVSYLDLRLIIYKA